MDNPMKVEVAGELSYTLQPYIRLAVEQAISDMPEGVRKTLAEVKTILTQAMVNIYPDAAKIRPKGYPDKTLEYNCGVYDMERKTINLAQTHMQKQYVIKSDRLKNVDDIFEALAITISGSDDDFELVDRYDVSTGNLYGVFLHEAGHALDDIGRRYSYSAKMQAAYDKDEAAIQQMSLDERHGLLERHAHYFSSYTFNQARQPSDQDARQEVFAEAFAKIIGGVKNSGNPEYAEEHRRIFTHSYEVVEKIILSIAPEANLYPTHNRVYKWYAEETPHTPEPLEASFSFGKAVETPLIEIPPENESTERLVIRPPIIHSPNI